MHPPKISIIISCKNAAKFIDTAIQSVVAQQYKNYELIIIDGKSTDDTVKIIEKYKDKIHYFHSQIDQGAADAQNIGLTKCTGDLIAFLFADDWFELDCFSAVARRYQLRPLVDIISCGVRHVIRTQNDGIKDERIYTTEKSLGMSLDNMLFGSPNISGKFFSKSLIKKLGHFKVTWEDGSYFYGNDLDYLMRASLLNPSTEMIADICHTYLIHNDSYNFGANDSFLLQLLQERIVIAQQYLKTKTLSAQNKHTIRKWLIDTNLRSFIRCIAFLKIIPPKSTIKILVANPVSTTGLFFNLLYNVAKFRLLKLFNQLWPLA